MSWLVIEPQELEGHCRCGLQLVSFPSPPMLILPLPILPPPTPGCVRELRIQGEEIVFHDLNLTAHGISHCPTCQDRPCQVTFSTTSGSALEEHGWGRAVVSLA